MEECLKLIVDDLQAYENGFAVMYGPSHQYEGFYGGCFQLTGMIATGECVDNFNITSRPCRSSLGCGC